MVQGLVSFGVRPGGFKCSAEFEEYSSLAHRAGILSAHVC
jgi:hypothetical protein